MTTTLDLPANRSGRLQVAFGVVVLAVGVWGGVLAATAFREAATAPPHLEAVGEEVPTSFGSLTVERVATLDGLTSEQLGGVTHGISNLVLEGSAQVEVSVLVVNGSDAPVDVVPDQFSLTVEGAEAPVPMSGSTIHPLRLGAGGAVEATLTFVVPTSGAAMTVHYAGPDGSAIEVDAGVLDQVAPPADQHPHG